MNMKLRRIAQLTLCLVALAATPALAQETTTPASEADRALLNEAAANLAAADSYRIDLNFAFLASETGRATEPVFRLTGTMAVDARAEMAEGEFTITNSTGEVLPTTRFILSGDTLYWQQTPTNQWWAFASDELMADNSTSDDDIAGLFAAFNDLNIAPYSALWRLPDEDGLVRLQTSFDLRSFLADPQIGNLVNALVNDELENEIGMTREEIIGLIPLLSLILQEAQLESGYQIAPQSGELLELSVETQVRLNNVMMSDDSVPLDEYRLSLVATFSDYNETSVAGQPPANAEFGTLEDLLQLMIATIE